MEMTESEIIRKYIRNGKESDQIRILAELNGTTKQVILDILEKNGVEIKQLPLNPKAKYEVSPEMEQEIVFWRNKGVSFAKISRTTGVPTSAVKRVLRNQGMLT